MNDRRDLFAAAALQTLLMEHEGGSTELLRTSNMEKRMRRAWDIADRMIAIDDKMGAERADAKGPK